MASDLNQSASRLAQEAVSLCEGFEEEYSKPEITESVHKALVEAKIAGVRRYAHWKDGVQYVGSCGKPLDSAIHDILEYEGFAMNDDGELMKIGAT